MEILTDLNMVSAVFRVILAIVCGGIIGAERAMRGRAAGIRTHMILCVGAAITVMAGLYAVNDLNMDADPLRVGAQVVSGIGFLGVGTILIRGRGEVTGLTTAAGLWTVAAIGIVIGIGYYFLAIFVTAILICAILILKKFEYRIMSRRRDFELYLELDSVESVNGVIDSVKEAFDIKEVDITPPRSAANGNVGMEIVISTKEGTKADDLKRSLKEFEHVIIVLESI